MKLKLHEQEIANKFLELKAKSGSHSPSNSTIIDKIPELNFKVDACFLSNPYATELFMEHIKEDLIINIFLIPETILVQVSDLHNTSQVKSHYFFITKSAGFINYQQLC